MHRLIKLYEKGNITEKELLFYLVSEGPTEGLPDDLLTAIKEEAREPNRLRMFWMGATAKQMEEATEARWQGLLKWQRYFGERASRRDME